MYAMVTVTRRRPEESLNEGKKSPRLDRLWLGFGGWVKINQLDKMAE